MTIRTQEAPDAVTLVVEGEIDHAGADMLKAGFNALNLTGKKQVVFNFQQVSYIGSAGLGKLLLFYKRLSSSGIQLHVQSPCAAVRDLLKELKMDTLFTVS